MNLTVFQLCNYAVLSFLVAPSFAAPSFAATPSHSSPPVFSSHVPAKIGDIILSLLNMKVSTTVLPVPSTGSHTAMSSSSSTPQFVVPTANISFSNSSGLSMTSSHVSTRSSSLISSSSTSPSGSVSRHVRSTSK